MNLTVNGKAQDTQAKTVQQLVEQFGLAGQAVAVELNQKVVPRKLHGQTLLSDGDVIELVQLVGGG